MKKLFFSLLFAGAATFSAQAQLSFSDVKKSELADDMKIEGDFQFAKSWEDKNAVNYIIVTQTPVKEKKDKQGNDASNQEMYVYHYLMNEGNDYVLMRKVQDYVRDCPLDLKLEFLENSLTLTDLDKDGIGEVTFIYRLACRGDVGGAEQKLMLLEDKEKYPIRGTAGTMIDGKLLEKGKFTLGQEFKSPKSFH
jgi:hypothetical protein